jgi:hypothetical protein
MCFYRKLLSIKNPSADIIPAIVPIDIANHGYSTKSASDPIATPPANVALSITSISNLPNNIRDADIAPIQLPPIDNIVLIIVLYFT